MARSLDIPERAVGPLHDRYVWPAVSLTREGIEFSLDTFGGGMLWGSAPCPTRGQRKPPASLGQTLAGLGGYLAEPCACPWGSVSDRASAAVS